MIGLAHKSDFWPRRMVGLWTVVLGLTLLASAPSAHASSGTEARIAAALETLRAKVAVGTTERLMEAQESRSAVIATILGGIGWLGLLLLFAPLALRRRYPGKGGLLLKGGAAAAVTFSVNVWLLAIAVGGVWALQGALGATTSPQLAMVGSCPIAFVLQFTQTPEHIPEAQAESLMQVTP